MKLAYLVEVAALVSAHGRLLVEDSANLSNVLLRDYYVQSRNRFNRWMRELNDIDSGITNRDPLQAFGLTPQRVPVVSLAEQVLVNDLLNRVWTVILTASDRATGTNRLESLADNVFRSHQTVRHKALDVCEKNLRQGAAQIAYIRKLKNSAERWADLLNCRLIHEFDLWKYCFDQERTQEFFEDRFRNIPDAAESQSWSLILAGLRQSFPDGEGLAAPLSDDDRMITRCIVDAFPADSRSRDLWSLPHLQGASRT